MQRPRTNRARAWAAVVVLTATALACAPSPVRAQRADQRVSPEVRSLVWHGVHAVSVSDLERSISTSASQCRSLLLVPFCWLSHSPTFVDKSYLNHDELRRDVLRVLVFYWLRGYRNASVDTMVDPLGSSGVRVTFDVAEGPPTRIASLRVEYDTALMDQRRVQKLATIRAGDPLNLVQLDSTRLALHAEMWNKGYADAVVDTTITVDSARHVAQVRLRAIPRWLTTIGTLTVRGNDQVSPSTIQNTILLRPGNVFRYSDLLESQRSLYESNLFRLALFSVPPNQGPVKNINIDVREAKMREARTAAGFDNVQFLQGDARYTNYNTFGGARRLDISGAIGNIGAGSLNGRAFFPGAPGTFFADSSVFLQPTWNASADLKQPAWLRKPENALALGAFAHRRSSPLVFVDRGYGGQLSFTRTLRSRAHASAAYRFEITRVEANDVYFCVNYGVCDDQTIGALRRHLKMSPLQLSAAIDRSDVPFEPTKGYVAEVDLEHASALTVSDYRYTRAFADAAVYTHFRYPSRDPRAQVLAAHVRIGWVRPSGTSVLHPSKRFYAGGSQSVRGYGENELGPKILTIPNTLLAAANGATCDTTSAAAIQTCSPNAAALRNRDFTVRPVGGTSLLEGGVEYRMPFAHKMEWAVFVDAAVVGGAAIGDLSDSLRLPRYSAAITPGAGFRYKSPVGPIRIDLGYNPKVTESLPVLTTVSDSSGVRRMVALSEARVHTSGGTATGFWALFNRLVLHLSIGEAF